MNEKKLNHESSAETNGSNCRCASTIRLTGLMVGLSVLLFAVSGRLAEFGTHLGYDDDWLLLTLPAGAVWGLYLFFRHRRRRWLKIVSNAFTVLCAALFIYLTIPITAPESVPAGMNRLPWGLGNLVRQWMLFLMTMHLTACLAVSAATTAIRQRFVERR